MSLLKDDYPSPERPMLTMSSELASQAAAVAAAISEVEGAGAAEEHTDDGAGLDAPATTDSAPVPAAPAPAPYRRAFQFGAPHRQAPDSPLTNSQQLAVLREFYARNPNPGKREYEIMAERTGRPWNKIREYFRQRRNKLRGLADLETMEEPGRATGWLQVTYRPGPATASVSQLALYNAYKTRFDPYGTTAPLLAGQELIQLACATFPGCEMARDEGDYVVRGLRDKEGVAAEAEWERSVDALVEPLRGATWLLSQYQHQADSSAPSVSQTELYSAYAARFSLMSEADEELKEFEANMAEDMDDMSALLPDVPEAEAEQEVQEYDGVPDAATAQAEDAGDTAHTAHADTADTTHETADDSTDTKTPQTRLLNPVELIALVRMTFPRAEAAIDAAGRFVIRGVERREGVEKGRGAIRAADMFPFAARDGRGEFTALLKRKLALLAPDDDERDGKRANIGVHLPPAPPDELGDEERELLEGLARFRHSRLGREVRDVCVQQ